MAAETSRVVQVTNIAHQATKDQMQVLFGYLGKIEDIRMYPIMRNVSCPVQSRICYIKFVDASTIPIAQYMTNTVFIDKALVVIPFSSEEIPDECYALEMTRNGTVVSDPELPPHVVNSVHGSGKDRVIHTTDTNLDANNLPPYPPLPAHFDSAKIEETRRTILMLNYDAAVTANEIIDFFRAAGEVKYLRTCKRDSDDSTNMLIEFTDQSSVINALKLNGMEFKGKVLDIQHATQPITKPQAKSNETAQLEIEEAVCRFQEALMMTNASMEPAKVATTKDKRSSRRSESRSRGGKKKSRSRSRSRKRSRSRRRRSTSRRRSGSRSRRRKLASRRKSRSKSRGRRSTSRRRSRSRSKRSCSRSSKPRRSRSKSRVRSRRKSRERSSRIRSRDRKSRTRDRSRDRKPSREKDRKSRERDPSKEKDKSGTDCKEKRSDKEKSDREKSDREKSDREKSDREKSDREKSDREKSDREKSDREKSDREKSDREKSDKEKSDKEKSDKEKSDKERSDKESSVDVPSEKRVSRSRSRSRRRSRSRDRKRRDRKRSRSRGKRRRSPSPRISRKRKSRSRSRDRKRDRKSDRRDKDRKDKDRRSRSRSRSRRSVSRRSTRSHSKVPRNYDEEEKGFDSFKEKSKEKEIEPQAPEKGSPEKSDNMDISNSP